MHAEALAWVAEHAVNTPVAVLDLGGRYINGTPKPLFPNADPYVVVDIEDGSMVDLVADAALWEPPRTFDVVICCEVCEHTPVWPQILRTAYKALEPGGQLIVTTAGPGRPPHSGHDGMQVREGEWYSNVEPADLRGVLTRIGFDRITVDVLGYDVRAVANHPEE